MQKVNRDTKKSFESTPSEPPVKVGDTLDVTIEGVGEKGDGFFKVNGFVCFVPSVAKGDKLSVRIVKLLRKVGFAEKVQ